MVAPVQLVPKPKHVAKIFTILVEIMSILLLFILAIKQLSI